MSIIIFPYADDFCLNHDFRDGKDEGYRQTNT